MKKTHERKIIALFSLGTSYQDIRMHIEDLYGIHVSNGTINAVTDKLLPELQTWRERQLEAVYPIVWLDAIHYKIKENGASSAKRCTPFSDSMLRVKKSCSAFTCLSQRALITG